MYIRKKKYSSGNIGIIVVEKTNGRMKELATIGIATSKEEIDVLVEKGREWIDGADLILDRVFDNVGFNRIDDDVLRKLVKARLSYPASKAATVE